MKTKLTILLIITLSLRAFSQDFGLGMQIGFGTFSMNNLNNYSSTTAKALPFEARSLHNFPARLYLKPNVYLVFQDFSIGIGVTKYQTGARISSKDYSGEYRQDINLSAYSFTTIAEFEVRKNKGFEFLFYAETGWVNSNMFVINYLYLNKFGRQLERYSIKCNNLVLEPGLKTVYNLHPFYYGAYLGYYLQGNINSFKSEGQDETIYYEGDPVKPGWNGLRFGLTLSIVMN